MNQRYREASVDVLDILNHMSLTEQEKVSKKFIDFLKENSSEDYVSNLDYTKSLDEMELSDETRGLISIMYRNYWCTAEEKKELDAKFIENEMKRQEELRERFNPDNVFGSSSKSESSEKIESNSSEETSIINIEKKEGIISKIINFIKGLFSK